MQKKKALIIEDVFLDRTLFSDENMAMLSPLDELDLEFAHDTNIRNAKYLAEFMQRMESQGPEGWIEADEEILRKLETADLLFVHASGVNRAMLESAKQLKAIFCLRSGTEGINLEAAHELGIKVSNCPSRLAEPVSDMVIALILSECRGITRGNLVATKGIWQQKDLYQDRSNSPLCNLVIGIVGFGGIGKALARKLVHGFGSTVLACDPYASRESMQAAGVVYCESLEELLMKADVVSLHANLTDATRNMIGEKEFRLMKPTAIFINTARAGLVDENALLNALQNGTIRGAGLDVYSQEPLPPDHPFISMQNVTLMPHRAGVTATIIRDSLRLLMPEVRRFLNGEKMLFQVNRGH